MIKKKMNFTKRTITGFLLFIVLFFAMRFILFGNPIAWTLYGEMLGFKDIGIRQRAMISYYRNLGMLKNKWLIYNPASEFVINKIAKILPKDRLGNLELLISTANLNECKYLAIGSSQTAWLFNHEYARSNGIYVLGLGGLAPWEYNFLKDYIVALKPQAILLFISDFDIARQISGLAIPLNPNELLELITLFSKLAKYGTFLKSAGSVAMETMLGYAFPEYKHGFIFRGMLNKLVGPNEIFVNNFDQEIKDEPLATEQLQREITVFDQTLDEKSIDLNIALLKRFLSFCQKKEINVYIQEGQYNPQAHNRRNRAAHEQVISKIKKVSADHPNVLFIPKSELYELTSEDFVDYAHVTPEAGLQYSKHLVSYLPFYQ